MDLNHSFTVPADLAETWRTFEDIESVAGCFPGAVVTGVDGDDFTGTCKVKLGPIAMVYSGTGTFLEKDESARRFVIDAKGKDKRGNGTAGAVVTAVFTEESASSTRVDVQTDLAITGKPAQFGRGVIEDISNKLLQQFVTCLQDKVGAPEAATPATDSGAVASPDNGAGAASDLPAEPADGTAGRVTPAAVAAPSTVGRPAGSGGTGSAGSDTSGGSAGGAGGGQRSAPAAKSDAESDDALDLGATVLPILARTYGPKAAVALVVVLLLWLLGRRR